jgi:hypothetical protein
VRHAGRNRRIVIVAIITCVVLALSIMATGAARPERSNLPARIASARSAAAASAPAAQVMGTNNPHADAATDVGSDTGAKSAGHQTNRPEGASS